MSSVGSDGRLEDMLPMLKSLLDIKCDASLVRVAEEAG